jgi:phage tail sheath protein FI
VIGAAAAYCEKRRAVVLVDAPSKWTSIQEADDGFSADPDEVGTRSSNAAIFFPRLVMANPLQDDQLQSFSAIGMIAGIFARTDTQRGVWKSPAGLDASLAGISSLSLPMTDDDNGQLNPLGINCLRTFPVFGPVVWGSRTLRGADAFADEYKYIAVRRTALFIEESLYRALKWVVFEPNDEPLWGQIRLNVGAFMQTLFRQGAFQGGSARLAYFVQCDATTTTQNDINLGIVNINVGFAPLKPAEFVVLSLQQMAGQIVT